MRKYPWMKSEAVATKYPLNRSEAGVKESSLPMSETVFSENPRGESVAEKSE